LPQEKAPQRIFSEKSIFCFEDSSLIRVDPCGIEIREILNGLSNSVADSKGIIDLQEASREFKTSKGSAISWSAQNEIETEHCQAIPA